MDFWVDLGATIILRLLKNPKERAKYNAVLAKIFVTIEDQASLSDELTAAIRNQREKR